MKTGGSYTSDGELVKRLNRETGEWEVYSGNEQTPPIEPNPEDPQEEE